MENPGESGRRAEKEPKTTTTGLHCLFSAKSDDEGRREFRGSTGGSMAAGRCGMMRRDDDSSWSSQVEPSRGLALAILDEISFGSDLFTRWLLVEQARGPKHAGRRQMMYS